MINLEEQYQALVKALDSFDVNLIQDTSKHINPADIATFTQRMNMPQQVKLFQSLPNGAYVLEYLTQAGFQKPLIGVFLDLQHVGDLKDLFILCVRLTHGLAEHYVLDHCHMDHHSLSFGFRRNDVLRI